MLFHASQRALAPLLVLGIAGGPLVACEASTNDGSSATFEGGVPDVGGGPNDAGSRSKGGGGDGGGDPGTFPTEPGISLANLWGTPLDFCFRPPGATDFTGPVFDAQGGIPNRAVAVRHPVPPDSFVILVSAGAGCASTPIFTGGVVTTVGTPAGTLVVRGGTISDGRLVIFRPNQHVAGKDNVYYGRQGRNATFVPNGGGAAITIADDRPTALDPDITGELRLGSTSIVTLPMKTATGVVLLLDAPLPETTPLLCDLLAPPAGHLHVCGPTVRAP